MSNKTQLGILLLIINLVSIGVILRSTGWLLLIFSVVIIPTIIYNAIISFWANKVLVEKRIRILIPNLLLLIFAFTRIDMDDHKAYTGFSSIMSMLGLRDSIYVNDIPYTNHLLFFNATIILTIIMYSSYIWYRLRQQKKHQTKN